MQRGSPFAKVMSPYSEVADQTQFQEIPASAQLVFKVKHFQSVLGQMEKKRKKESKKSNHGYFSFPTNCRALVSKLFITRFLSSFL